MMILAILVFGLSLSAFFSGSETGFYRITRVRLLMDAMSGKRIARFLLWLANHPTLVVATVLIGNNMANYFVSFGLVLASQRFLSSWGESMQTLVPVLATPLLFIYGELLPKYLYYNAPYYLSTRGAPLMVLCTVLFLPISIVVIGIEWLWQRLIGGRNVRLGYTLERQELQRVMMEGQEAGILRPVQRELTQNIFTYGLGPIRQFAVPLRALPIADAGATREQLLDLASRHKQKYVGLNDRHGALVACHAVADLILGVEQLAKPQQVMEVKAGESTIQVLCQLQTHASPLARIVDSRNTTIGIVFRERLINLLLSET